MQIGGDNMEYNLEYLLEVAEAASKFKDAFDRYRHIMENSTPYPDVARKSMVSAAQNELNEAAHLFNHFLISEGLTNINKRH